MRKLFVGLLVFLSFFVLTCSKNSFDNPFNPDYTNPINSGTLDRLLSGTATVSDLQAVIQKYKEQKDSTLSSDSSSDNAIISMPYTGKLFLTLRDNDAGWRSELYMKVGDNITLLFEDTRVGPLNVTTEYAYDAGTQIEFFLVTYTSDGTITNNANSQMCKVEYYEDEIKWILNFEDDPEGDFDYNDAVIEVQMSPDYFIDLSDKFDISIEYLNPHGYTEEGYAIYYIGETMHYNVKINVLEDDPLFEKTFVVYAIHEYFEDETCDRWWYPSPPRPEDEPQVITVHKGDPLPEQDPVASWENVSFSAGELITLNGSYTAPISVAAGNDQTHIIIVRQNKDGHICMTIYDNPEAGVFDPPPIQ